MRQPRTTGQIRFLVGHGDRAWISHFDLQEQLMKLRAAGWRHRAFESWKTGSAYQSGLVDVYLSGSQTSGLPVGQFVYDIEKYPSGASNTEGAVDKILAGDFFVYPQVTT